MSRKMLQAVACSQMDSPKAGSGTGGDRCTAAVAAMIDVIYWLGPKAKVAKTPAEVEQIMYDLVDYLNPGHTTLPLENMGVWFPRWLSRYGYDKVISLANVHNPGWSQIKADIDRAHVAIIGVNDYRQLRQYDGGNPYAWDAFKDPAAGHVLLLVGYDDNFRGKWGPTVMVNDPLRGTDHSPWDYSFPALQKSGFSDLTEIVGAALPFVTNTDVQPPAAPDPVQELADLQARYKAAIAAYSAWIAAAPKL